MRLFDHRLIWGSWTIHIYKCLCVVCMQFLHTVILSNMLLPFVRPFANLHSDSLKSTRHCIVWTRPHPAVKLVSYLRGKPSCRWLTWQFYITNLFYFFPLPSFPSFSFPFFILKWLYKLSLTGGQNSWLKLLVFSEHISSHPLREAAKWLCSPDARSFQLAAHLNDMGNERILSFPKWTEQSQERAQSSGPFS